MMHSIVNGELLDWSWKKWPYGYKFYIGDNLIGFIYGPSKMGWTALHHEPKYIGSEYIGLVSGFKTRYDASHFLLKFEPRFLY